MADAYLYDGDRTVRFHGGRSRPPDGRGVMIAKEGIEGWLSTPPIKTELVERAWGNGAHDVPADGISYSARTVTIHIDLVGTLRSELQALARQVNSMSGRMLRLRVADEGEDTYVECYLRSEYGSDWNRQLVSGTLTFVCPRPERMAWEAQAGQVVAPEATPGGLSYGDGGHGLAYPLDYGVQSADQSRLLLRNAGTACAYPVLTANGDWPDGLLFMWGKGGGLDWRGRVHPGVPRVLDCRTQAATMGGVDVSRGLVRRGFPLIEPGGDIMLRLLSAGGGWVDVLTRDTYI